MKKITIFLMTVFLSCAYESSNLPQFNSLLDAQKYVALNIIYSTDKNQYGFYQYYQKPQLTYQINKGSCLNKSILLGAIAKEQFNAKVSFIGVSTNGYNQHMIVKIDNVLYDSTSTNRGSDIKIVHYIEEIDYNTMMFRAYNNYHY